MGHNKVESGFTIAEILVTITILSLFLALFFQVYMLSISQKNATILRASANDIAQNNLRKISNRTDITATSSVGACDTTAGGANTNNLLINPNASGSVFAPNGNWPSPLTPETPETLASVGLPASTTQSLTVVYPKGCNSAMPAKVIATVTYGSVTIVHAAFFIN